RKVAARWNPLSRTPDGGYRSTISRLSSEHWPLQWRAALYVGAMVPVADELVITIADLVADSGARHPIRAELHGWGGSADSVIATATDGTGSVTVLLLRNETENFREFVG